MSTNITETEIKLKRNKSQMDTSSVLLQRGEPFYNSNTNELFVGNADSCVLSQLTPINGVKTINGQTGDISVGEGLTTVGNTLSIDKNTIVNRIPDASTTNKGLMSSDDKSKLDAIDNRLFYIEHSQIAQPGLYQSIKTALANHQIPVCVAVGQIYFCPGKPVRGWPDSFEFISPASRMDISDTGKKYYFYSFKVGKNDICSTVDISIQIVPVAAKNNVASSATTLTGITIDGVDYKIESGGSGTAGVSSLGGVTGDILLSNDFEITGTDESTLNAKNKVNDISVNTSDQHAQITLETTTVGTTYSANIGLANTTNNKAGLLSPSEKAKITSLPTAPTSADANKILSVDSSGNGQWTTPPIVVISVNKNNNTIKYNNQIITLYQLYTNYYAKNVHIMIYHENENAYYTCVSAETRTDTDYWKFYMSKCNSNNSVSNFEMEFSAYSQTISNVTSYTIPQITSGTVNPVRSEGQNGDIYIKYQ